MPVRLSQAAPIAVVLAILLAIPACKRNDGPPGPGLDLPADKDLIRQSTGSLKMIGRAMLAYADTHTYFPRGIYGPDGKLGLSWRVAILPHIGQQSLYNQFKHDEAWDSDHNKQLIARMPKFYAAPESEESDGNTYYCAFEGKDTLMPPAAPGIKAKAGAHAFQLRYPASIPDGTSNTLLVVEAAEPVVWTKPQDIPFDKDKPVPQLGGIFRKVTNVVMCDGAINYIKRDMPEATIKALITPAGAEKIPNSFFDEK